MQETRLLLKNTYANDVPVKACGYEVVDAWGRIFEGILDETGHAVVVGLAPGPAQVRYGKDASDTFSPESYVGTPSWPPEQAPTTDNHRAQRLNSALLSAYREERVQFLNPGEPDEG